MNCLRRLDNNRTGVRRDPVDHHRWPAIAIRDTGLCGLTVDDDCERYFSFASKLETVAHIPRRWRYFGIPAIRNPDGVAFQEPQHSERRRGAINVVFDRPKLRQVAIDETGVESAPTKSRRPAQRTQQSQICARPRDHDAIECGGKSVERGIA
jgi:hypothetical protein